MGSACVYEDKSVIYELTQGIQMAKQLKVNLHSPEAREFLIQKILSSYEKALFVLKSGNSAGQHRAPARLAGSLPESSISNGSLGSEEFDSDKPVPGQKNVISKKRCFDQFSICDEDGLAGNTDDGYNWKKHGQKDILDTKFPSSICKKHMSNHSAQSVVSSTPPVPPLSTEKQEITPPHDHKLSPPNPGEMHSNHITNLSVDSSDLGSDTVPSLFSFHSTSFGLMEDYNDQFQFPNHFDDGLLQIHSPSFISPATSGSDFLTEWGSSSSLNFLAGPADVYPDFEFTNTFF